MPLTGVDDNFGTRNVRLGPWRIGEIAKAALVLLHLDYDRPLPPGYST